MSNDSSQRVIGRTSNLEHEVRTRRGEPSQPADESFQEARRFALGQQAVSAARSPRPPHLPTGRFPASPRAGHTPLSAALAAARASRSARAAQPTAPPRRPPRPTTTPRSAPTLQDHPSATPHPWGPECASVGDVTTSSADRRVGAHSSPRPTPRSGIRPRRYGEERAGRPSTGGTACAPALASRSWAPPPVRTWSHVGHSSHGDDNRPAESQRRAAGRALQASRSRATGLAGTPSGPDVVQRLGNAAVPSPTSRRSALSSPNSRAPPTAASLPSFGEQASTAPSAPLDGTAMISRAHASPPRSPRIGRTMQPTARAPRSRGRSSARVASPTATGGTGPAHRSAPELIPS